MGARGGAGQAERALSQKPRGVRNSVHWDHCGEGQEEKVVSHVTGSLGQAMGAFPSGLFLSLNFLLRAEGAERILRAKGPDLKCETNFFGNYLPNGLFEHQRVRYKFEEKHSHPGKMTGKREWCFGCVE